MKNLAIFLLAALFFSGCSQKNPSKKDVSIYVSYYEINGTKQQLQIKKTVQNFVEQNASVPFFGVVNFLAEDKILNAYSLAKGTINILKVNNNSINLNKSSDILALKKANEIKFYEIRPNVLEGVKFSSQNSVCGDFLLQKPVHVNVTTNYYLRDDSFFASLIEANFFYKKGAKILKKEFVYNIAEAKTLKEAKEFTQKTKQLFLNDLQKLGRLLDILCTF